MMCFMVSWLLISNEESSMEMFLWEHRNWLFMLLQWKVTVSDKHSIPSQKLLSCNPDSPLFAMVCRAAPCTSLSTHFCNVAVEKFSYYWDHNMGKVTRIWQILII